MFVRNSLLLFFFLTYVGVVGASSYTKTQYPIVLLTGLGGSQNALGPLPMEYFYGIEASLESSGASVWTADISPIHDDYTRGEQAIRFIEDLVQQEGVSKVNLIGHSQGGLTGRYVAGVRPDLVASLTTIGTPHNPPVKGLDLGEILFNEDISVAGITIADINEVIFNIFGDIAAWLSSSDQSNDANAMIEFGKVRFDVFNAEFPQGLPVSGSCSAGDEVVNGVRYYSMGGTARVTTGVDPSDGLFLLLGAVLNNVNDGAVGQCQSHLGRVIRDDFFMNHFDQQNGLYGVVYPFATHPKTMYRRHANYLKTLGL